jgi:hypothetical protein
MKIELKRILTGALISGLVSSFLFIDAKASSLDTQSGFKLQNQEKLHNQTDFRSLESLKDEQFKIKEIIVKFEILEEALTGFEDKFVVNKIKQEFMNKYLIDKADLLLIKTRINQQIKIKENPEAEAKFVDEQK